jgi:hypothetical protein
VHINFIKSQHSPARIEGRGVLAIIHFAPVNAFEETVTHHLRTATHRAQTVLGLLLQQSLRDDDTCEKDVNEREM